MMMGINWASIAGRATRGFAPEVGGAMRAVGSEGTALARVAERTNMFSVAKPSTIIPDFTESLSFLGAKNAQEMKFAITENISASKLGREGSGFKAFSQNTDKIAEDASKNLPEYKMRTPRTRTRSGASEPAIAEVPVAPAPLVALPTPKTDPARAKINAEWSKNIEPPISPVVEATPPPVAPLVSAPVPLVEVPVAPSTPTPAEIRARVAESKARREGSGFKEASQDMTKKTEALAKGEDTEKPFWTTTKKWVAGGVGGTAVVGGGAMVAQNVGGGSTSVGYESGANVAM